MINTLPTAGASRVKKIGRARERRNSICLAFSPIYNFLDLVALLRLEFRSDCISSSICSDAIGRIESNNINVDVNFPSFDRKSRF
jgi:hypothetical protein